MPQISERIFVQTCLRHAIGVIASLAELTGGSGISAPDMFHPVFVAVCDRFDESWCAD
jgi:hypothetical protein